jgi:ATPase involved in conjugal plasmid transfer
MGKKVIFYIFLFLFFVFNIAIILNIKNYIEILNVCFNKNIIPTNKLYATICIIIVLISIFIMLDILLITLKKENENKGIIFKPENGTFGTSDWMKLTEIKQILTINDIPGIILGKFENYIVKLPLDSYFNKNICVFGSSGSMKTTAFLITNLLELSKYLKSIVVTDPKSEIYRITSSYFRSIGYVVKVFNLKDMRHSDRWNPLAENENLNDVQMSSNTIILNTQKKTGKDEFWPRAEENLLKAFEFYFLQILVEQNNLTNIYKKIAGGDLSEIDAMFKGLPNEHPAKMSYNIFASGSDTIKASVITGLGTRLQTFQNEDLQRLTSASDIDLTLPGKEPCIYYIITDDMNGAYDFLSSLFYTFLFIKLVRYADSRPNGKCDVDVFCFLDEFANIRSNSRI